MISHVGNMTESLSFINLQKPFPLFQLQEGNKEFWRTKQCFAEIITDFDKYFQRKKRLFLKRRYYVFLEPAKLSCLSWIFYWSHRIFGWAVRFLHEVGIILVIEHCPFHMRYNLALHFAKNLSQHWIGYFSPINSFFFLLLKKAIIIVVADDYNTTKEFKEVPLKVGNLWACTGCALYTFKKGKQRICFTKVLCARFSKKVQVEKRKFWHEALPNECTF